MICKNKWGEIIFFVFNFIYFLFVLQDKWNKNGEGRGLGGWNLPEKKAWKLENHGDGNGGYGS